MNPSFPLHILGLGPVGGFGSGRDAFARALTEGCQPTGTLAPTQRPAHRADTSPLDAFLPRRSTRRADAFARMALLGACLALEDAGLPTTELGEDTALVIASGHGATGSTLALQDGVIQDGDACASPIHFANSLHNSAAAQLSLLLGLKGPCVTVTQGALSTASALLAARTLLREGRAKRVLFGGVEELSELTGLLWGDRPGLPGEGAAFLVLTGPQAAPRGSVAITDLAFGGPRPEGAEGPGALAATFGESPVLSAFHLAAAALRLAEGPDTACTLSWQDPVEGDACCRLARSSA